jgi:hypothetical protein
MSTARPPPTKVTTACAVLAAAFAGVLIGLGRAAPASASATCTSASHCYAIVQRGPIPDPHYFTGVELKIHTQCLSVADPSAQFVTAEVWMLTHETHERWIETGQAYGYPEGARKYFFRAVYRYGANGQLSYTEHDDTAHHPDSVTAYETYIVRTSTSSYAIASGPFYGTSSGWSADFQTLQTGSETSQTTASAFSSSRNLAYYQRNGTRHPTWTYGGAAPSRRSLPASWGYEQVVIPSSYYRYGTVNGCGGSSSRATSEEQATSTLARFGSFALAESAPGSAPSVDVRFSTAASTMVLTAHGHFVGRAAKVPPGVAPPTGTVLSEVVRTDTGQIIQWSLG